jgi:hypothetical protein
LLLFFAVPGRLGAFAPRNLANSASSKHHAISVILREDSGKRWSKPQRLQPRQANQSAISAFSVILARPAIQLFRISVF